MKNNYEIRGEITAISLNSTKHGQLETLISTSKLSIANDFPNTWYASYEDKTKSFYAVGNLTIGLNKRTVISLHQWIMGRPKGMMIDHINHETLDNYDENLRIVTMAQNGQNRKGATSASKSGIRGVNWNAKDRIWTVRMNINGKVRQFGRFQNLDDAETLAIEMRRKYMPFSTDSML